MYSVKHSDLILTVSCSVAKELKEKWPQYSQKVRACYPGLYTEYNSLISAHYESELLKDVQPGKFFLFTGTIESRKNICIIIKAFYKLLEDYNLDDYNLILAGKPGHGFQEISSEINNSQFSNKVVVTGYISSKDISKLYKEALAYIFPSIYEGFGSTQLECMVNGTPLILSDIPTNREVSGEYGMFFDVNSIEQLEMQMYKIVNGEYDHEEKNKIAKQLIERFSWDKTIEKYIESYEEIVK